MYNFAEGTAGCCDGWNHATESPTWLGGDPEVGCCTWKTLADSCGESLDLSNLYVIRYGLRNEICIFVKSKMQTHKKIPKNPASNIISLFFVYLCPWQGMKVLFHGAGSANLGGAQLLREEVHMAPGAVVVTNSRGQEGSMEETISSHLKIGRNPRGNSSSSKLFSGAMLVLGIFF